MTNLGRFILTSIISLATASFTSIHGTESITQGDLTFSVNASDPALTVSVARIRDASVSEVIIPRTVEYDGIIYEVSAISTGAFKDSGITSVTIPQTVMRINSKAFEGCKLLSKVIIEDGVPPLYMSNNYSYSGDSDRAEGRGLFSSCPLKEVYIGRNLTYPADNSDGYSPFAKHNITKAEIGPTVTNLYRNLFWGCLSLKEISFAPNSNLTTISDEALSETGLESLILPDSATDICGSFRQCRSLTKIHFGKNLKNILLSFFRFDSLAEIDVDPDNQYYYSENRLLYSHDKKTLLRVPISLEECNMLPVTSIENGAFRDCSKLKAIDFPDGVTTIQASAVTGCRNLTSIILPATIQTIGGTALGNYYYKMSTSWYNDGPDIATFSGPTGCLISKANTPPAAEDDTFTGRGNWTLWVPEGAKEAYSSATEWTNFGTIVEGACSLNVSCNIAMAGDVSGTGDYQPGETVTLSVIEKDPTKYTFEGWYEGPTILSTDRNFTFKLMRPIREVVAKFEPIPDAAQAEVTVKFIDGHLIIDILSVENGHTYITQILNEEGQTVATVKTETFFGENPAKVTDKTISEILDPSEKYTYHVKIYDTEDVLLAHYIGSIPMITTSISDIESENGVLQEITAYYRIDGALISAPKTPGVYIVRHANGKFSKILVK